MSKKAILSPSKKAIRSNPGSIFEVKYKEPLFVNHDSTLWKEELLQVFFWRFFQ